MRVGTKIQQPRSRIKTLDVAGNLKVPVPEDPLAGNLLVLIQRSK